MSYHCVIMDSNSSVFLLLSLCSDAESSWRCRTADATTGESRGDVADEDPRSHRRVEQHEDHPPDLASSDAAFLRECATIKPSVKQHPDRLASAFPSILATSPHVSSVVPGSHIPRRFVFVANDDG